MTIVFASLGTTAVLGCFQELDPLNPGELTDSAPKATDAATTEPGSTGAMGGSTSSTSAPDATTTTTTWGPEGTSEMATGSSGSGGSQTTGADGSPCGNGEIDEGEECDEDIGEHKLCTPDCLYAVCGDGYIYMDSEDPAEREECDDGGENSNAGVCTEDCKLRALAVFVTSKAYPGNLIVKDPQEESGLHGADEVCRGLAAVALLPQSELFMAWISDGDESPATRFVPTELDAAVRPYALLDGTPIASDWSDLVDGTIENPINLTELWVSNNGEGDNVKIEFEEVWTNTSPYGDSLGPGQSCGAWESAGADDAGRFGATGDDGPDKPVDEGDKIGALWSQLGSHTCSTPRRLYCFEQPGAGG